MDESIRNILEALYLESSIIKTYVDGILDGNPIPYTLIGKSDTAEKNEKIIEIATKYYHECKAMDDKTVNGEEIIIMEYLGDLLDLDMVLEPEEGVEYEVVMFKDDVVVEGSKQIVNGDRIANLKQYADFKKYTISVKPVLK